jgi:hypothetical protein
MREVETRERRFFYDNSSDGISLGHHERWDDRGEVAWWGVRYQEVVG